MAGLIMGRRIFAGILFLAVVGFMSRSLKGDGMNNGKDTASENALQLVSQGKRIFRYDTFGDQASWGDALKLHQTIEGSAQGGVGPGLSPKAALTLGSKVDIDALDGDLAHHVQSGGVNLDDPVVTLTLLQLNLTDGEKSDLVQYLLSLTFGTPANKPKD